MHERSLVQELLRQVDQIRSDHRATSVTSVTVRNGALSGVESALVRIAFEDLTREYHSTPNLVLHETGLTLKCNQCREETVSSRPVFRCVECGTADIRIIDGDAFILADVELAVSEKVDDQ